MTMKMLKRLLTKEKTDSATVEQPAAVEVKVDSTAKK